MLSAVRLQMVYRTCVEHMRECSEVEGECGDDGAEMTSRRETGFCKAGEQAFFHPLEQAEDNEYEENATRKSRYLS